MGGGEFWLCSILITFFGAGRGAAFIILQGHQIFAWRLWGWSMCSGPLVVSLGPQWSIGSELTGLGVMLGAGCIISVLVCRAWLFNLAGGIDSCLDLSIDILICNSPLLFWLCCEGCGVIFSIAMGIPLCEHGLFCII